MSLPTCTGILFDLNRPGLSGIQATTVFKWAVENSLKPCCLSAKLSSTNCLPILWRELKLMPVTDKWCTLSLLLSTKDWWFCLNYKNHMYDRCILCSWWCIDDVNWNPMDWDRAAEELTWERVWHTVSITACFLTISCWYLPYMVHVYHMFMWKTCGTVSR